jgi:hypothetical protein
MRALKYFLPVLAIALLAGCAGYRLGPVNGAVAGEKSIEILPFNNQTLQPRLNDTVTEAVRERVQTDGTYRLATDGAGDLVMSGTLLQYSHAAMGYLNRSFVTPQNYRVGVVVRVTVRERASGKVLFSRDVKGHTLVNVGLDFASSERQALPLLAADLAENVVKELAEGSW